MTIHLNRGPVSIVYRDRDVISIVPMTAADDVSPMSVKEPSGYEIYGSGDGLEKNDRFIAYFRSATNGEVQNGLHAVVWVDGDSGATTFFKEVISPKLVYDRDSNVLMMFFWTNFKDDPGVNYNVDNLFTIDEHNYDPTQEVYPTLCVTYGTIQKWIITGGGVPKTDSNDGPDIIPVFKKPIIVTSYPLTLGDGDKKCIPAFDFVPEVVLYKAVADEDEGANTIDVKTCDVSGEVSPEEDAIITLRTLPKPTE